MFNRPPVENHLDQTTLHKILVFTERLGQLSPRVMLLLLAANVMIIGVAWAGMFPDRAVAVIGMAIISAANVGIFALLPRAGRSWGSPNASILILCALQAVIMIVFRLLGASALIPVVVNVLLSVVVFYATWIEPFNVQISRERYPATANAPRLKILHISDMHLERISPREQQLNAIIQAEKPDLIAYTGDFVNISYTYDATAQAHIRQVMGEWVAPLGAYVVAGTPAVEPPERVRAFTENIPNLHLLENEWRTVETPSGTLHILGLVTSHDMDQDRAALANALKDAPKTAGMRLLLVHTPDLAPEASAAGFDLYFCGHTHGGQLRLPLIGAVFTGSHYGKQYAKGRYDINGMALYVTRGLGMEGFGAPRARLGCSPEVVIWEA